MDGYVGTQSSDVAVRGDLGVVSLIGRYVDDEATIAAAGIEANLSPALKVGVVGGSDGALIVGGYAKHLPFEQDSVIPGLGFEAGVLLSDDEGLTLDTVHGAAEFTIGGGEYYVAPNVTYRRVENQYQAIIPGVRAGYSFGSAALEAEVRYGLVDNLAGGAGRNQPEGRVGIRFANGAFADVSASSGLPGSEFISAGNPLGTGEVELGFSVGYAINLDALR